MVEEAGEEEVEEEAEAEEGLEEGRTMPVLMSAVGLPGLVVHLLGMLHLEACGWVEGKIRATILAWEGEGLQEGLLGCLDQAQEEGTAKQMGHCWEVESIMLTLYHPHLVVSLFKG